MKLRNSIGKIIFLSALYLGNFINCDCQSIEEVDIRFYGRREYFLKYNFYNYDYSIKVYHQNICIAQASYNLGDVNEIQSEIEDLIIHIKNADSADKTDYNSLAWIYAKINYSNDSSETYIFDRTLIGNHFDSTKVIMNNILEISDIISPQSLIEDYLKKNSFILYNLDTIIDCIFISHMTVDPYIYIYYHKLPTFDETLVLNNYISRMEEKLNIDVIPFRLISTTNGIPSKKDVHFKMRKIYPE